MTTASNLEVRALRYLVQREYSRLELERKLSIKCPDSTQEVISAVLDKLEQHGYLSAERLVEQVMHTRRHKFGSQRIVHELKEKGIAEHLIAAALPDLKETELDAACDVWKRKFSRRPDNIKERSKQVRFLMGRGFSLEIIHQVLSRADKGKI
ncbi:MAG: recombination regulator RecX [Nitrosomonas sp.]|nr:recombination regulator RecX [Nitrosomonas sp.]MDP1951686.1 recombination regulator RecX [Nitrosomonas sp.]